MTDPRAASPWHAITGLVQELKACERAGFTRAGLVLAFVAVDSLAYLAMPAGQPKQGRADFITWVNTYLRAHASQPYQYRGLDVYAARCAVLHAFSDEAQLHRDDPAIPAFTYHDGGQHRVDPATPPRMVAIGLPSFVNDVVGAIEAFLRACETDAVLRARVAARLPNLLLTFPL